MDIAPFFGALTLVIVLFDGGVRLRLGELMSAAPRCYSRQRFVGAVLAMAAVSMVFAKLGSYRKRPGPGCTVSSSAPSSEGRARW